MKYTIKLWEDVQSLCRILLDNGTRTINIKKVFTTNGDMYEVEIIAHD